MLKPPPDMCPVDFFFFAQPLDFVLFEQILQDHAIQVVEVGPRNLSSAYFVHRRPITEAPAVGEFHSVNTEALRFTRAGSFGNHGTAPIHNGAESIENACFHVGQFGVHATSVPCLAPRDNNRDCGTLRLQFAPACGSHGFIRQSSPRYRAAKV